MKLYLDSKDLINILDQDDPWSINDFDQMLRHGNHELVLSLYSVIEIAAPLCWSTRESNVMKSLNCLEKLPLVYLHAGIDRLEFEEALMAFAECREYTDVVPFVRRFDETVDLNANPATKVFFVIH